jgi:hypothetical protein
MYEKCGKPTDLILNESFSVMNWKGLAGTRMSLLINFGLKMNTKKQIIYCVIL